ncbi:hypothetical protein BDQ12DRAFT_681867 [Crucibulum laeve]|uniref:Uncharacterized protein n=1 Tax=Crucibulum laeve TaxID=68775 RepID=A0A5C3M293_9AGAR|nr:hypothetical protein BDQ12DRAFT_681867 [Crucibulum laeve]
MAGPCSLLRVDVNLHWQSLPPRHDPNWTQGQLILRHQLSHSTLLLGVFEYLLLITRGGCCRLIASKLRQHTRCKRKKWASILWTWVMPVLVCNSLLFWLFTFL